MAILYRLTIQDGQKHVHTIYRQKLVNMFCIYTYNFEFLIYVNLGHYNLRQSSRKRDVGYAYALLCEKVLLAL